MSEQNATNELNRKIAELDNLNRVLSNGLNLLADIDIKIAHIQPVSEFIGFLQGFKNNIGQQKTALESALPKAVDTTLTPAEPVAAK